jgi:hypothetical protein
MIQIDNLNDAVLSVPQIAVTFVFTNLDKELTIK